ncbi:MAG: hypothetical protein U0174_21080 [Polyangiaceae bacterium]
MLAHWIDTWGSTPAERSKLYPCDALLPSPRRELFRAVTIAAPPPTVFRWLCQMRTAPYSYDLIDNGGRCSPRTLTPGLEALEVGQPVMRIFALRSFVKDEHITLELTDGGAIRVFGKLSVSYVVEPLADGNSTRLVAKLALAAKDESWLVRLRRHLLAAGDLFMMRKQLLTFKELAEA